MNGVIQYLNPEGLHRNPAYSQVVVSEGPVRTVYVGGQDAVDAGGNIIGKGDLAAQTVQILKNLQTALAAAGAKPEHVVKWTIYVVAGQDIRQGFGAFQQVWGRGPNPPLITFAFVAGLANPDFLVEIDAIALVPA